MIQRIQTLYMVLVVVLMCVVSNFLPIFKINGESIFYSSNLISLILFLCVSVLTAISIFRYKNRKQQFVINRISIILNFLLVGFMVYRLLNVSGGTAVPEKGIGMILPLLSIFLLSFANKAIKRDEDLVKSVDRIR